MYLDGQKLLELSAQLREQWMSAHNTTMPYHPMNTSNVPLVNAPTFPWVFSKALGVSSIIAGDAGLNLLYCLFCRDLVLTERSGDIADIVQSSIFNDILQEQDSPALAIQAQLTMLLRMAYYAWLPLCDANGTATMTQLVQRPAPVANRGFWAVMSILIAHVLLCAAITFLFHRYTRFSLPGNAWAAFSQIMSAERVQALMKDSSLATDNEVKRRINEHGDKEDVYYVVADKDGDGAGLAARTEGMKQDSTLSDPFEKLRRRKKDLKTEA